MTIKIHNVEDFESMRVAGKLAAEVLDMIQSHIQVGITTNMLDKLCYDMIIERGAIPACLGYRGYTKTICTSLNHVVCHGIPDETKLKDGDILNIDVTVIVDGWHGDTNRTYWVGNPSIKAKKLTQVTYEAMMIGIEQVKPGNFTGDIGQAIQRYVEQYGYSVVRDYCGHGIGRIFHDEPNIIHYRSSNRGFELKPGMFFTIEPMINAGTWQTKPHKTDGWTVYTKDRELSAQFEHTIGVTENGYEIFTLSPKNTHHPNFYG